MRKRDVLRCFHEGLVAEGADGVLVEESGYEPCQVAIIFGGRPSAHHEPTRQFRREIFKRHRGTFVLIETPLFGRRVFSQSALTTWIHKRLGRGSRRRFVDDYGYYRVGIDGFLQDDAYFNNDSSPPDRWRSLSRSMQLDLKPYRRRGRCVLIVGQVPGDLSLRGLDIIAWMEATATAAQRLTTRPILVRPHPATQKDMMKEMKRRLRDLPGVTLDYPPCKPVQEVLKRSWVMVTYSSGAAVDALIEGVPCITFSPASMAWPVSDHRLECIERPTLFAREQWLYDLSYAQWSPEEMREGLAWRHLRAAVAARAGIRTTAEPDRASAMRPLGVREPASL